jgi:hypothetical protein
MTFIVAAASSDEAKSVADRAALAIAPTADRIGARRVDFQISVDGESSQSPRRNRLT